MAQKSTGAKGGSRSGSSKGSSKQSTKGTKGKSSRTAQTKRQQADTRIVDAAMRHDILGVVLIVLAVAFFIGAVMPTTGVITAFIHKALHISLGVGAYLLPVALAIIGVCFLIRFNEYRIPTRVVIGVAVIFVAVLVICALCTPGTGVGNLTHLFDEAELDMRGGYLGAGIAWVLCELLGKVISIVLMVGVIIVGLVIIGFSASALADKVRAARERHAENRIRSAKATPTREVYRDARVDRASGKVKQAYPTSDYELPERDGVSATGDFADTERLSTKILNRLKGTPDNEEYTESFSSAPTQAFVDGNAPTQAFASAKGAGRGRSSGYAAPSSYLPPAAPIPHPAYDNVDAATAEAAEGAQAQTMTRKLSRKSAAKPESTPSRTTRAAAAAPHAATPQSQPAAQDRGGYTLPSMSMLVSSSASSNKGLQNASAAQTAQLLQDTLEDFHVYDVQVVGWVTGPTVTLYKLQLPAGLKVQAINNLSADLSRVLMVDGIRIYSPVKGTPYVGIEVPNHQRETVHLADVLKDAPAGPLQIAIGKDVDGNSIVRDLSKMPHLLIGGTTGSGKTIAEHSMIISILMRATPDEVRLILIDPKRVEFNHYEDIPHLCVPPVTDPKEASNALSWAVAEMELRLKKFQKVKARDIKSYNTMVEAGEIDTENASKLPYIVIVIDELADLMMNVGKEVEFSISRIAQLARAAGIHLIIATQRPDANIVTGLIKANITNRMAFKVSSGVNSRVVIDQPGAENLIGQGDMLFQTTESPKPVRIQSCYVDDKKEINPIVEHWKAQGTPDYNSAILTTNKVTSGDQKTSGFGGDDNDPLLWEAADLVVSNNFASTSTIQRKLSVGYARAGRIMDQLEEKGIVGPSNGSKPRDVLVSVEDLEAIKAFDVMDE